MSTENNAQPVKPQSKAAKKGVDIVLGEGALASLTSYFDVLIQMDLEQQSNERNAHEGTEETRISRNSNDGSCKVRKQETFRVDKARHSERKNKEGRNGKK